MKMKMRMKHEWLGVAIMALTMTGCSQNEVTDMNDSQDKNNEISFDFSTGKRATDATVGTMQSDDAGFMVFGTQNWVGNEVLVDNQKYHYKDAAWKWKDLSGDNIPKWPVPERYPVYFYAYYPSNLLASNNLLAKGALTKSIQVKEIAQQIDMLAASQSNILMKPSNSRLTFTFGHMLSKVAFKAEVVTNARAYIQSVSVNQVKNTQTFDFALQTWAKDATNSANYIFRKSPDAGNTQVEIAGGSSQPIPGDGSNAAMMLMPQTYASNDIWAPVTSKDKVDIDQCINDLKTKANIQMIYRMTSSSTDVVGYRDATTYPDWNTLKYAQEHSGYKGGLYIKVAYALGVASWEKGKSYTYEFKLGTPGASGGYLIHGTFFDENGVDTGAKVIFPGGGPIDPGNPPFETGGNIDFDIIVNEWDTTDANKPLN